VPVDGYGGQAGAPATRIAIRQGGNYPNLLAMLVLAMAKNTAKGRLGIMHWYPKIQASGTGLALVTYFGPTLGIDFPYGIRLALFILGIAMLVIPVVLSLVQLARGRQKMWPVIGMIISGLAFIGCVGWYLVTKDGATGQRSVQP
jgi:hypothetical protein